MQHCCIYYKRCIFVNLNSRILMSIEELLKLKGVRSTGIRLKLIQVLMNSEYPLQQKEIEERWDEHIDRVTLYRNLKFLTSIGIIHKIEVSEFITSYNVNNLDDAEESSEHLHFHCVDCDKVICMPQHTIDEYKLPEGFMPANKKLIIDGTCKWCNTNG
ncbi:transcriptional repressor [Labilibacter sediminis]|nr:transcriptional repressor [Labilibacter sediminis]